MKFFLVFLLFLTVQNLSYAQSNSPKVEKDSAYFNYLDLKEKFDFVVEYAILNPECASKERNTYSLLIGGTVVGDRIERISVLIPCLENEYEKGNVIEIIPIKKPKKNIAYLTRSSTGEFEPKEEVIGYQFPAVWGEVAK